jgi:hypothetical protein
MAFDPIAQSTVQAGPSTSGGGAGTTPAGEQTQVPVSTVPEPADNPGVAAPTGGAQVGGAPATVPITPGVTGPYPVMVVYPPMMCCCGGCQGSSGGTGGGAADSGGGSSGTGVAGPSLPGLISSAFGNATAGDATPSSGGGSGSGGGGIGNTLLTIAHVLGLPIP